MVNFSRAPSRDKITTGRPQPFFRRELTKFSRAPCQQKVSGREIIFSSTIGGTVRGALCVSGDHWYSMLDKKHVSRHFNTNYLVSRLPMFLQFARKLFGTWKFRLSSPYSHLKFQHFHRSQFFAHCRCYILKSNAKIELPLEVFRKNS